MKAKKPLGVRIFIRICVVFMAISLIGVYVVYMFAPQTPAENVEGTGNDMEEGGLEQVVQPEVNVGNVEDEVIVDGDNLD